MPDPYKKMVEALETRFTGIAAKAVSGLPSELATVTASGLKLDSFPHELPDYLVADWTLNVELPAFSLVGTTTAPVNATGEPLGGAVPSPLTRFDFMEAELTDVRLSFGAGLKPGDRVLAVPVKGGKDAVVLCKVVGSGG